MSAETIKYVKDAEEKLMHIASICADTRHRTLDLCNIACGENEQKAILDKAFAEILQTITDKPSEEKKDRQRVTVKLPSLYVTKELGNPGRDGHRRVYGASCCSDGTGTNAIKLYMDGVHVGGALLRCSHQIAKKVARQMLYWFISGKEKKCVLQPTVVTARKVKSDDDE